MAPEMKWNPKAELDLCAAILLGNQDGERVRPNWAKVSSIMEDLGYEFSKDAMAQHLSKHIMRDFKARCELASSSSGAESAANAAGPPETPKADKPRKATTPRKKGTAATTPAKDGSASAKRRRSSKKTAEDGADADAADGGSAKKTKVEENGAKTPTRVKSGIESAAKARDNQDA
ncbi:hypothetical protein ESCO_005412 [Escovopsis weberi]|uniref:Uncharacterized protein n=1 Tax=Escovopsis weberi TaxID=150374 RepID=A0A0M8N0B7_ESCWE|nr:hypothetical protein ESCO_005412 [Escovopsis weberi]